MGKKKIVPKKTVAALPIEWNIPEGLMTPFASNMVVQNIENEFKISFFEIKPPLMLDDSLPLPQKVRADYLCGVIVTADRLPKFIEVLRTQLTNYQSKKQTK